MSGIWDMGVYAAYVWPAYGVSAVLLAGAAAATWRAYVRVQTQLAALEKP